MLAADRGGMLDVIRVLGYDDADGHSPIHRRFIRVYRAGAVRKPHLSGDGPAKLTL
ncbi:MAG TPA: hypothetical protein VJP85_06115 [Candidatus Baltobacteraceae bacterium]|nr:hypothetical protein [Candidatus Baltobacteraceae bacterium]